MATKTTVVRIAEAVAWVQIEEDKVSKLRLANGGFAFDHDENERLTEFDFSMVPNIRPRELPVSPTSKDKITVSLYAARATFVSDPVDPEEAAAGATTVEISGEQVEAGKRLIVPGQ